MIDEKWQNSTGNDIAHYKYVYDGKGNIVRSIDFLGKKEYNYEYEDGRIVRATEADIVLSGEIVTKKTIIYTVRYYYNTDGRMIKKEITPAVGSAHTVYYETNNDNTVVKFSADGRTVTSHSKTDSFGRKEFDELQLGTDFISRQFVYHAGKVTDTHKDNAKVKSSATTQLVSQIILSDGRTLSYEYDAEERITKVTDSVDGTTTYTYDALGQLLTETKNGIIVNTMVYDNYGNIVKKNGKVYTYGNTVWKDLLTGFDGKTISYDAQGNPTSYLGHTLTWEKGRQLKSFDSNTYTYNANGIRTSKTVGGVKHTYTLEGTKILRETWGANTLIPIYDNEESVCGILYNNTPYYFIKNLQGDIIAIVDKDAQTVAEYSYDAWGVPTVKSGSSNSGIANVNPFRYRGYYYDAEIGLYYLQSRYYNPVVGRFINADGTDYLAIDGTILACNIICYCQNSPTQAADPNGHGPFLAIGVQFVITLGRLTIGLEALWSTANWKFYLFGFVGGSRSFNIKSLTQTENALMEDIIYLIRSVRKFSISSFSVFKRLSIAVSFIAVLGNKHASFPCDYCGWFTGVSLSIWHVTASGAYSLSNKTKIGSLGLGVTTSKAGASFGQTFYFQLTGNNALNNSLDALKSGIRNKLAFLKLFACFF